jgi:hypothetical protein
MALTYKEVVRKYKQGETTAAKMTLVYQVGTAEAQTITVSKAGGAFGATAGSTATQIGATNLYALQLHTGDLDTVGELTLLSTGATDQVYLTGLQVVEYDPYDAIADILADTGTDGVVLAADAITSAKIADDAFSAEHFADDAIVAATIATGAITADAFAADAIVAGTLATGVITSDAFAADAIVAATLGTGCITADAFAANAIVAATLATDCITAAKIADGAIDAGAIATDAIGAAEIAENAIAAAEMAATAISEIAAAQQGGHLWLSVIAAQ